MCYNLWYNAPRCCRPVAGNIVVHNTTNSNTQSSAPEDGRNNCPKHVELTGDVRLNDSVLFSKSLKLVYDQDLIKQVAFSRVLTTGVLVV